MMTRIFLFEEQQLFNEALQFFINSQPNYSVVGSHNDEGSLLECLYGVNADIILFGISMMSPNSNFMIEQIKNEFKNLKIIVLNDGLDIKEIRRLYKSGVHGFLEKKSHNGELLNSIDSVMSGKIYLDVKIRERFFSEYFDNNPCKNSVKVVQGLLTIREKDVMRLICEGYNSKEIAEELFISINTVETHRKKIIQKFNVKNSIGIVRFAMQNNMI